MLKDSISIALQTDMKLFPLIITLFFISALSCKDPSDGPDSVPDIDMEAVNAIVSGIGNGALALRKGNDITSNMLAQFNIRDKRFSHIGICFIEDGAAVIYHSLGAEHGGDRSLRRDLAWDFFSMENNLTIGYAPLKIAEQEKEKLHQLLRSWYQQKIPFDINFDLKTDDSLYCTEMVAKALMRSCSGLHIPFTDTFGRQYYAVENITQRSVADSVHVYSRSMKH